MLKRRRGRVGARSEQRHNVGQRDSHAVLHLLRAAHRRHPAPPSRQAGAQVRRRRRGQRNPHHRQGKTPPTAGHEGSSHTITVPGTRGS